MAKGGVVFQDAEELKRLCEEEAEAWDRACQNGEEPDFDEMLKHIASGLDRAKESTRFVDVKRTAQVLLFYKMLIESVSGEAIRISYQLPQEYAGQAALVRIVGKDINIKNLTVIRFFKQMIGGIEIEDHTDGTIKIDFSFFDMSKSVKAEDEE